MNILELMMYLVDLLIKVGRVLKRKIKLNFIKGEGNMTTKSRWE